MTGGQLKKIRYAEEEGAQAIASSQNEVNKDIGESAP